MANGGRQSEICVLAKLEENFRGSIIRQQPTDFVVCVLLKFGNFDFFDAIKFPIVMYPFFVGSIGTTRPN